MMYEHTVQVDDYNIEKECVYKNEDYLVCVNGAVLRFPLDGKKARPVDNKMDIQNKKLENQIYDHRPPPCTYYRSNRIHGANDSKKLVETKLTQTNAIIGRNTLGSLQGWRIHF